MAAHLGMSTDEFIQRYTQLRPDRLGLALLEKPNGECVLLDGVDCRVHPVKPRQCRTFPSEWYVPEFAERCRAMRSEFHAENASHDVADEETDAGDAEAERVHFQKPVTK